MKTLFAFFLTMFITSTAWSNEALLKHGDAQLQVEIAVHEGSLDGEFYKSHGIFFVDTKVTNISHHALEIITWTQYGWSWISNNPQVHPGIEALANVRSSVILKPGQSYARPVEMFSGSYRPVTFRLGFAPNAERPLSGQPNVGESEEIFWSNPVTLTR